SVRGTRAPVVMTASVATSATLTNFIPPPLSIHERHGHPTDRAFLAARPVTERSEQRLAARHTRTAPLMETLRTRLTAMVGQLFSQSKLTEAINYTLNHWDGLTLFLSDGRVEVDTNTVERSMRPIAMGRRNSLFSGSEGGAESWAILASLVNTAKLH